MASMSYCKFENTSIELEQCVDVLRNAGHFADLDNNRYETYAMIQMLDLCREFVKQYSRLEVDGAPDIY